MSNKIPKREIRLALTTEQCDDIISRLSNSINPPTNIIKQLKLEQTRAFYPQTS